MQDQDLWLSRKVVAHQLGVGPQTFDDAIRPKLDAPASRGSGRSLQFNLPACVAALVAYRVEQSQAKQPPRTLSEDDALLYSDADSPNLERLRAAKADREEMARDRDRGTHANLRDIHTAIMWYGGALRRTGEVLQRRFGGDAADIYNQGVDDAERETLARIGADGPGTQAGAA